MLVDEAIQLHRNSLRIRRRGHGRELLLRTKVNGGRYPLTLKPMKRVQRRTTSTRTSTAVGPSPATDIFIFVDWGLKVGSTTRTFSSSVQFSLLPWVVHTNVSNLDVQAHAHKDEVQDDQIVTKGLARFEATERNHNQGREQAQDQKGPRHLQIGDLVDRVPVCIRFQCASLLSRPWLG